MVARCMLTNNGGAASMTHSGGSKSGGGAVVVSPKNVPTSGGDKTKVVAQKDVPKKDSPSTGSSGVARFKEKPELKTVKVDVPALLKSTILGCLKEVKKPSELIDTNDIATKVLTRVGTGEGDVKAIVEGYQTDEGERVYQGDSNITRDQALKMLMISSCTPSDLADENSASFQDVSKYLWSFDFIESAKKLQIVNGFEDGTYRPNNNVTRIEVIAMLTRMGTDLPEPPASFEKQPFADIDESHWGYDIAREAFYNNIIAGTIVNGKRYFFPDDLMTRNAMAPIISNFFSAIVAQE